MKNVKSLEQFMNEQVNGQNPLPQNVQPQPQTQPSNEIDEYKKYTDKIDLTLLSPSTTIKAVEDLCAKAVEEHVYAVCIPLDFVSFAKGFLENSDVLVCTVVDFPKGNSKTSERVKQIKEAIQKGADEIDIVFNYTKFLKDDENTEEYLLNDLKECNSECTRNSVILKVIIEISMLTYENIISVCNICKKSGVVFVKTSTGFISDDNFEEKLKKVKIIRQSIPDYMKVKLAGGIRTLDQLKRSYAIADRIGTSVIPKN